MFNFDYLLEGFGASFSVWNLHVNSLVKLCLYEGGWVRYF